MHQRIPIHDAPFKSRVLKGMTIDRGNTGDRIVSMDLQRATIKDSSSLVSWGLTNSVRQTTGMILGARNLSHRPQLLKIYALNLSISLSAGKESNSDAPSNGE